MLVRLGFLGNASHIIRRIRKLKKVLGTSIRKEAILPFSYRWFLVFVSKLLASFSLLRNKILNKWELAVAHPQGGSSSTVSRSNWNLEMLVLRRGENRSTWRKRFRSKDENQQQTLPTYDAESGTRTRAAPTTAPSLLPCLSVNSGFI